MLRPDGIFTIENSETGEFRTFKLETVYFQPDSKRMRVLSYLRGPSNSSDFEQFAFLFGSCTADWKVKVWGSKRAVKGEPRSQHERFGMLVEAIIRGQWTHASRYLVLEAEKCSRCGERLTVPESIRRGIGPVCAKR